MANEYDFLAKCINVASALDGEYNKRIKQFMIPKDAIGAFIGTEIGMWSKFFNIVEESVDIPEFDEDDPEFGSEIHTALEISEFKAFNKTILEAKTSPYKMYSLYPFLGKSDDDKWHLGVFIIMPSDGWFISPLFAADPAKFKGMLCKQITFAIIEAMVYIQELGGPFIDGDDTQRIHESFINGIINHTPMIENRSELSMWMSSNRFTTVCKIMKDDYGIDPTPFKEAFTMNADFIDNNRVIMDIHTEPR